MHVAKLAEPSSSLKALEVAEELLHAVTPEGGVSKTYDRRGDLSIAADIAKRPLKTTA